MSDIVHILKNVLYLELNIFNGALSKYFFYIYYVSLVSVWWLWENNQSHAE